MTRWFRYSFIAALVLGALLLFIAVAGGASFSAFEQYYPVLLTVNIIFSSALLIV